MFYALRICSFTVSQFFNCLSLIFSFICCSLDQLLSYLGCHDSSIPFTKSVEYCLTFLATFFTITTALPCDRNCNSRNPALVDRKALVLRYILGSKIILSLHFCTTYSTAFVAYSTTGCLRLCGCGTIRRSAQRSDVPCVKKTSSALRAIHTFTDALQTFVRRCSFPNTSKADILSRLTLPMRTPNACSLLNRCFITFPTRSWFSWNVCPVLRCSFPVMQNNVASSSASSVAEVSTRQDMHIVIRRGSSSRLSSIFECAPLYRW